MPNVRVIKQTCGGGEVSPLLYGRPDLEKYSTWLATCRNMITTPQGAVTSRPGSRFVLEANTSSRPARLIPFIFSDGQNFAIEINGGFFRFHYLGGTLMSGGTPYQLAHSYADADLFALHFVQSGNVITIVHPNYPPAELTRITNTNWTLTTISFSSPYTPPTVTCAATYPTAGVPQSYKYVVTVLDSYGKNESVASAASTPVTNDLTISGNYNTVSWSAVTGAGYYNIYQAVNGSFGYIGQVPAGTTSFIVRNITPDFTQTPPLNDGVMASAGNYPGAVAYYEQRRVFGGTTNQPQNVWATQSGTQYNMNYSVPSRASDALRFQIVSGGSNRILHAIRSIDLILMTASGEFRVYTANGDALTPTTLTIKAQADNGASNVQPIPLNNRVLYGQYQNGRVREMSYEWTIQGYKTNDLCVLAQHLFDGNSLVDMCFTHTPNPILWVINNQGALLGLTYLPDQEITAWHRHDSAGGVFESCCSITENGVDMLYVVVRRTINGVSKRYVEYIDLRQFSGAANAYFVDCGYTYNTGTPVTTISGITWLEGQTVSILADGVVMPAREVISGTITLDYPATVVQIGLGYNCDLQTLPPFVSGDPTLGQTHVKNVNRVWVRTSVSGSFLAGPDSTKLAPVYTTQFAYPGTAMPQVSDELAINIKGSWNQSGQVLIRQADPLPLTVLYVGMEVAIGG